MKGSSQTATERKNNATEDWHRARRGLIAFLSVQFNVTLLWWRSKWPRETPLWRGVGITVIAQPAVNGERGGGICFNSNADLRREEKLENSDAYPAFREQHDCKYSLSRPKRQADYMHHVETFINSINFFSSTIS